MQDKLKIAIADDHRLFRDGLVELLNGFDDCQVVLEAADGLELTKLINANTLPDLALLDLSMPNMDGFETAEWLKTRFPDLRILALSMNDADMAIIRMIKIGVNGYVLKDIRKEELHQAIQAVMKKGFYYSDLITSKMVSTIHQSGEKAQAPQASEQLSERELEFLKLSCTEMTYKDIADKMCLSAHTVDGYRDALFKKLNVKSRVGLAMYAIRHKIVIL